MKAAIFDFDGTLANTLPLCYYAFRRVFKDFDGRELARDEIKQMFGPTETEIIRKNLLNPKKEETVEYYYEIYTEFHPTMVEDNSEIRELLGELKRAGWKLGIYTGKAKRSLDLSLKFLQMNGIFDAAITGDDVIKPKPDPEGLLEALSLLKVKNRDAVYAGDSDADVLCGSRAGVFTIGVQWLPDDQTSVFQVQPDRLIKNMDEFRNFLREMG
jgi:haloacid dehalogenase superfamily, subfamily IA, variant 1 with third motif having Dx(3-4)D or Dx(3-4)E